MITHANLIYVSYLLFFGRFGQESPRTPQAQSEGAASCEGAQPSSPANPDLPLSSLANPFWHWLLVSRLDEACVGHLLLQMMTPPGTHRQAHHIHPLYKSLVITCGFLGRKDISEQFLVDPPYETILETMRDFGSKWAYIVAGHGTDGEAKDTEVWGEFCAGHTANTGLDG